MTAKRVATISAGVVVLVLAAYVALILLQPQFVTPAGKVLDPRILPTYQVRGAP